MAIFTISRKVLPLFCPRYHHIIRRMFVQVNSKHLNVSIFPYSETGAVTAGPAVNPEKPTVVFIHGLGSSQNYYLGVVAGVTGVANCIVMDTEGSGRSPLTGTPTTETVAADAVALLDNFGVSAAVFVGHSMGGMIVNEIAATYPTKTLGTVLIGPVHPTAKMAQVFDARITTIGKEQSVLPLADVIPWAATGSAATPLHRAFIRELISGTTPAGYVAMCHVIAEAKVPNYAAINCKTLIIAGAEDKSAPWEGCVKVIADSLKDVRVETLPGVGHWHCIEAAPEIGGLVKEFVASL